ncbi:PREDICTED: oxysterol-binding protein-related protein 1-like [Priapulus caudatus]|uniref:Oxysterol-binding protein-related protein 1-like n=1 Tax=Priapulus caudatus TaxID=37621 RepID=A0ABM1F8J5_PRICU|nr:PREDICTED: oxysterol-binding protein-related protein 1-like [Priapulus caudatus]
MNPVLEPELTPENLLLHASRNGMVGQVRDLIQARHEGSLSFDLNARGKSKSNCGWAALHLACYFGHGDVVGCLLQNSC